jgi:hypothetical protein
MTALGEAYVVIRATTDKLGKDLAGARGTIDKAMTSIGGGVRGLGALALGGAVAGVAAVGTAAVVAGARLINLASDAEEMQSKFNVVFANVGGEVSQQLDEFALSAGRSKFELRAMASTFGDTLKPMGFTESAAGDLSVMLSELAVDLGSFNNMETDEALQRLQGTLIGSHENALAFGVIINENTLAAEMAANGWDELTGAELEQAKVQARINLLLKGTTDAQGDAIRTADGWANSTRALTARFTDFATELGMKLLPIFTPLLALMMSLAEQAMPAITAAFDLAIPIIDGIVDSVSLFIEALSAGYDPLTAFGLAWGTLGRALGLSSETIANVRNGVTELVTAVSEFLAPIIAWVQSNIELNDVLIALGLAIASVVVPAILSIIAAIAPIVLAFVALVGVVALLRTAWEQNWGGIQEKTAAVIAFIVPLVNDAIARIQAFWAEHGQAISDNTGKVWDFIAQIITDIFDVIDSLVKTFTALFKGDWETFNEETLNIWRDLWDLVVNVLEGLWDMLKPVFQSVWDSLRAWWEGIDWAQLGRDIISGIVAGMQAAGGAIVTFLQGLMDSAIDGLKAMMGISSPSKVMAESIGAPMAEGVLMGWGNILSGTAMDNALQMAVQPMAMMAMADDAGPMQNVTYSSTTTVNTSADPGRVLRASRHLDALGAML